MRLDRLVPRGRPLVLGGLGLVAAVAVADAFLGRGLVVSDLLVVPVLGMAVAGSPVATAVVAGAALAAAVALGLPDDIFGEGEHLLHVTVVALSGILSVGLAGTREARERRLAERDHQLATSQLSADLGRRLRVALSSGRMGTWVWHAESGHVVWDTQLEALFGLGPGEYDGSFEAWVAMLHPDDRDSVVAEVDAAVTEGRDYTVEHRCIWPDGTVRWLEGRGEVFWDESGNVAGTTGVTADVTARKLAEEETAEAYRLTAEVLSLDALFDPRRTTTGVAALACAEALRLFECDSAAYWTLHQDRLRLVCREPVTPALPAGTELSLGALRVLEADLASLRPTWLGADRRARLTGPEKELLDRAGTASSLRVPIAIAGRASALLTLGWAAPTARPSGERTRVVERFAEQVALATAQAQRRAAQDEAGELTARLQAGLVPETAWTGEGFRSVALYQPGEDRLLLGGDFYDLLARKDGSATFVLGDVSGHGPEAAALGATLRSAWSALARTGAEPEASLAVLHQVVRARRSDEETFATVIVGDISPDGRFARYALAGHPPPIVLGARGAESAPAITGLPLGVGDEPDGWPLRHLTLPDPGALLLFTDGLIEGLAEPGSRERYGTDRLLRQLGAVDRPWSMDDADLASLVAGIAAANGKPLGDDVAVLLLTPTPSARSVEMLARQRR